VQTVGESLVYNIIFDYIGINRWNNDYKKQAVFEAVKAMASGRKNGDTI